MPGIINISTLTLHPYRDLPTTFSVIQNLRMPFAKPRSEKTDDEKRTLTYL